MKRTIDLLRWSAKLLLVLLPAVLVTGFLTAKPFLLGGDFATYRLLHTRIVPLLFVPVLVAHSTAGILFMLSRSKRYGTARWRRAAVGGWLIFAALVGLLYLADPKPAPQPEVVRSPEAGALDAAALDGGPGLPGPARAGVVVTLASASEGAASASAAPRDLARAGSATGRAAPGVAPVTRPPTAAQLVQRRCSSCHGLDVVYAKPRSAAEWSAVLDRMVAQGAVLSAGERSIVMGTLPRPPS